MLQKQGFFSTLFLYRTQVITFLELEIYSFLKFNCWNFHGTRLQQSF